MIQVELSNFPERILIKFISEEEYCEKLLEKGEILLSKAIKYIKMNEIGRGDPNEFVTLPSGFSLYVKDDKTNKYKLFLPAEQICGPMRLNTNDLIYSMYYTTREELRYIDYEKIFKDFASNNAKVLYGVCFDYDKFVQRFSKWLDDNDFSWESDIIKYNDFNKQNKTELLFNPICRFRKDSCFKHQKEYRFVIEYKEEFKSRLNNKLNGTLINIGSLEDVGFQIKLKLI